MMPLKRDFNFHLIIFDLLFGNALNHFLILFLTLL